MFKASIGVGVGAFQHQLVHLGDNRVKLRITPTEAPRQNMHNAEHVDRSIFVLQDPHGGSGIVILRHHTRSPFLCRRRRERGKAGEQTRHDAGDTSAQFQDQFP